MQGPKSRKQTLNKIVNMRPDMTLKAVIGNDLVEDSCIKLRKKRRTYLLCDSDTMELNIKIRCELFKVAMSL